MIIKIKKTDDEIKIISGDKTLEIRVNSETWNSKVINDFLISVATKDSENKIDIEFDESEEDAQYKWVVDLFQAFKNIYEED